MIISSQALRQHLGLVLTLIAALYHRVLRLRSCREMQSRKYHPYKSHQTQQSESQLKSIATAAYNASKGRLVRRLDHLFRKPQEGLLLS